MTKDTRFVIQGPEGDVGQEKLDKLRAVLSPQAVLSLAITYASRATKPGVWRVREYEDVIYTVRRSDGAKPTIEISAT